MSHSPLRQSVAGATAAAARYLPACALLLAAPPVCAQHLSARHYNVSDGLAHSHVAAIYQDRKGYIWFGTREGLSRFDGYRFTNYGARDGLEHLNVNDITEDRQGRLWVGTNGGGVARLIDDPREVPASHSSESAPGARRKFVNFRVGASPESNYVNALLFDANDHLWLATDDGLYRAAAGQDRDLKFEEVSIREKVARDMPAFADRRGRLWFGIVNELIEVVEGRIIKYGPDDGVGRHDVVAVVEDQKGRLLVANAHEVFEFVAPIDGRSRGRWLRFPLALSPDQRVSAMVVDATGALWIGTWNGLIMYRDGKQTLYTDAQGLSSNYILSLFGDRDGNLWIGSRGGGVSKISGEMIVSFTRREGLPDRFVERVIEDRRGRIYARLLNSDVVEIVEGRVLPVPQASWPFGANPFQDSRGDWWIGNREDLFRFEGPDLQLRRGRKFNAADGIPADEEAIHGSYLAEDPFGTLWIARGLSLYRATGARKRRDVFERIPLNDVLPQHVFLLMSDRAGTLWMGGHNMLARFMKGKVSVFQPTEGLPVTYTRALFQDSRGWIWIGLRYGGVSVIKVPSAENPKFINYSPDHGLSSYAVFAIAEDDAGRIYLGTGKGLDQLDLASGRIRHFNTKEGLAGDVVRHVLIDRSGAIWIATETGLSKFNPRADRSADYPPPIYFSRAQVAGEDLPLAETGARSIPELELPATRNNLLVEYVALSFRGERRLRYQHKLEGVDEDWSQPSEGRMVNYSRLAPGSYRFMARAINQDGATSPEPAVLQFRILPPLWQRWWFLASAATLVVLAAYALHRYRVAQFLELERMRTRIATDLHDDIGANLTRIAILSEVAQQRPGGESQPNGAPFPSIARIARESVASMSDIVWAINPRRDSLRDLARRMRGLASEVFSYRNIEFRFQAPDPEQDLKIGPDVRRAVYLIFKEAVNNIVRHAACARTEIELRLDDSYLALRVSDDGRGFEPRQALEGNGLENMKRRAQSVRAEFEALSQPGRGTVIALRVPVGRRVWTKPARKSFKRPT